MTVNELKDSLSRNINMREQILILNDAAHPAQHLEQTQQQRSTSPTTATIKLKHYFPQLEHVTLEKFGGKPSITWPQLVQGIPSIALCDIDCISAATTTKAETLIYENSFEIWAERINLKASVMMTASATNSTHHHDQQRQQQQQQKPYLRK